MIVSNSSSTRILQISLLIWCLDIFNIQAQILAQIIPDKTLGNSNSIVTPNQEINDIDADLIEGGAKQGNNLFHSFQEFNIKAGRGAYFANPDGIQNIFGRVTGGKLSGILGTLGVRGNANLFFLNPKGIIFGENSSLDISGSFLATTADSFVFENGFEFGTINSTAPPLLTINIPIGLQFGSIPGNIDINSQAGLNTLFNQTIGLVGGNINLEAGKINAQGRIELGAVASNDFVGIQPQQIGWKFNYDGVNNFADINLLEGSFIINESSEKPGGINLQGKRIDMSGGSFIDFINSGSEEAGELTLSASESISFNDKNSGLFTYIDGDKITPAHHIKITTPILLLQNSSEIRSESSESSKASAGDITINASELVKLTGKDTRIWNLGFEGNSGEVSVETTKLLLQDGGRILSSTLGSGQAGTIKINAQESIQIIGFERVEADGISFPFRGGLFARSETNATGNAGNIIISTSDLLIQDGAEISTASLGDNGKAGNIIINNANSIQIKGITEDVTENVLNSRIVATTQGAPTGGSIQINNSKKVVLDDGGQILTSTFADGEGGSIKIINAELVEVTGSSGNFFSGIVSGGLINRATGQEPTGNAGNLTITTDRLNIKEGGLIAASTFGEGEGGILKIEASDIELTGRSILDSGTVVFSSIRSRTLGSGRAGNLNIITESLTIKDDADIAVSSTASGNAGNLNIFAADILITDNGAINVSATGTGQAGSLNVNAQDIILNNGSLTAETRTGDRGNITIDRADTLLLRNNSKITTNATEQATGGDITLTSDVIALLNNSNITANAIKGRGGDILITTQGLFQDPDSEITATSNLGIDGTISINTPDVDPASGLVELPDVPIDVSALLARNICDIGRGKTGNSSSFINTGRGGLPPNPYEPLDSNNIFVDVQLPTEWRENSAHNSYVTKPIVEATAWVVNEKGNVELVSKLASKNLGCR